MAPRWTAADDAALRSLYATDMTLREIGDRLGRSGRSADDRRRRLELPTRRDLRSWTTMDDAIVRAAASAGLPDRPVARRLGRPEDQVRRRRRLIVGPRSSPRSYSTTEDELLRACWADSGDIEVLARELGRSAGSLRLRAQNLGIHRPLRRRRWQRDEDAILRDGYERALSCAQIADQLPGRSPGAVAARAGKLGIATYARVWLPLDDQRLRTLVGEGLAVEPIAQALGRTPQALTMRARRLDLVLASRGVAPRAGRPWTTAEDDVLRVNGALNPAALASALGRSSSSVVERLRRLGLKTGRSPHHPVVRRGTLTPGERLTAAREVRAGGPGRVFAVARRLDASPQLIRAAAAESMRSAGDVLANSGDR